MSEALAMVGFLQAEIERLRAALEFYANADNWDWHSQPDGNDIRIVSAAGLDAGQRARDALSEP